MTHRRLSALILAFAFLVIPDRRSAFADSLPRGWATQDIGSVGAAGAASVTDNTVSIRGSGADIWNAADAFRFAYATLAGDGEIVARVASVQNVNAWTKAGVMMRETLTPGSKHLLMLVSPGKGYAFQRRLKTGGTSVSTDAGSGTAPSYVRLTRAGATFTAYVSTDGATWTRVGSESIAMTSTLYVGLAVSSHVRATLAAATFTDVALSAHSTLPAGWQSADIGATGATGTAAASGGTITVNGAGADVWDSADAFRFAYTPLQGDGSVAARVASVQNVDAWTKAGVMIRDGLGAGAPHAFMLVSPGKGLAFQQRTTAGGASASTQTISGRAPSYVKLTRSGSTITAYSSTDGASWTAVGSATIDMHATVYAGVAVSSHVDGVLASAQFTSASVVAGSSAGGGTVSEQTGSGAGSGSGSGTTDPPPSDPPPSVKTLRVMHWNTHHGGYGTDGRYDTDRLATWIAKMNPDVVSLNEIEKNTGWGNEDQPAKYKALLEKKTGHTWYMVWAQEYGNWNANGKGNLIFSRYPWVSTARYLLPYTRTVALGQIVVNGRNITFASSHLDPDVESRRLTEAEDLLPWAVSFAENRIIVGDMNAQPTSSTLGYMKHTYTDGWLVAKAGGFAHSAKDNPNGYTRNSRIDYVMTSSKATHLRMTRFEVVDVRDAKGVMPSDHRPLVVDYAVN